MSQAMTVKGRRLAYDIFQGSDISETGPWRVAVWEQEGEWVFSQHDLPTKAAAIDALSNWARCQA